MRSAIQPRVSPGGDRGSALVIVLGSIAVMALLVVHVTTWSEIVGKETKTDTTLSMLRYAAESAAERALWMHVADKRDYGSRTLLTARGNSEETRERWLADGAPHRVIVDGVRVDVAIKDAAAGFTIATVQGVETMRQAFLAKETDFAAIQTVETFVNSWLDYIDRGDADAARLNGMERPEYDRAGLTGLPRNGAPLFREELFWLPSSAALAQLMGPEMSPTQFLDFFHPVSPGADTSRQRIKPAFFSSSPAMLRYLAGLDEQELMDVLADRSAHLAGSGDLFASVDPTLAARLKNLFSFVESGVITIEVTAVSAEGDMRRTHTITGKAALPPRKPLHP
ncbi:MAG: hypothetical protein RRC34_08565 [Lentisphaeria bacterium]|nr:hypothetical protein [Lentisphaeria bacterium]